MKIKYKLILVLAVVILVASLPLSLFILGEQENEKIALISRQGALNSRILARSAMNILLMNGGNVSVAQVDARDMMGMFAPLTEHGLVLADAVLVSARQDYNGALLARMRTGAPGARTDDKRSLVPEELERLVRHPGFAEAHPPGIDEDCYEFVSASDPARRGAYCIGRLVFSKRVVLAPIRRLRLIIYGATAFSIGLVCLLGFALSRFISRPIDTLTEGLRKIEIGDLDSQLPVRGHDELSRLATTFNHLLRMINLQMGSLIASNRELKRLDQLKDEFLANMTHELRTPLAGMIGLAEALQKGAAGELPDAARHDLTLIEAGGRRLSGLVNDILDYSKLKYRDIELSPGPVDMHSVAQSVLAVLSALIAKKSLTVENRIAPGAAVVLGDKERLLQVMMNLVGNAVKFTERGGIVIAAEDDPRDAEMAMIVVSDTGIGVPADKVDRIFEMFEQADGSLSRSYGGTGIGLAITRKLIEMHGGRIWVDAVPGGGSRFSFTVRRSPRRATPEGETAALPALPAITGEDVRSPAASARDAREEPPRRVLIVEDDPINMQVLVNYLALEGYDALTAETGPDALALLESAPAPDLVILDVMLPKLSGYDVCRRIRATYQHHDLPVLMLTAKVRPEDVVAGIEAGANDYLPKPVSKEELLARVNNLISMKNAVREREELLNLKRDLHIAHEIQQALLSQDLPRNERATVALRYLPMYELGGDFYSVGLADETKLTILIADVSGHGIAAALICAMLKVACSIHREEAQDPSRFFERVNATMYDHCYGQFVTACYVAVDLSARTMVQANAGPWPALVWKRNEGRMLADRPQSMPFGWVPEESFVSLTAALDPGDRIVLYTDGIIEARDHDNQMFGDRRFHDLIIRTQDSPPEEAADAIMRAVTEWSGKADGESLADDVTLVVIDVA